jgi:hypothetical protein
MHIAGEANLLRAHKLLIRGQHLSAIAFMSVQGLLDVKVVKGGVDGDVFYDYVQNTLLPHLMPFNGTNPHSVVVLDNCVIHHIDGIADMIREIGAIPLFYHHIPRIIIQSKKHFPKL